NFEVPCSPFEDPELIAQAAMTYLCGFPIGATVAAIAVFSQAMEAITSEPVELLTSCVEEVLSELIDRFIRTEVDPERILNNLVATGPGVSLDLLEFLGNIGCDLPLPEDVDLLQGIGDGVSQTSQSTGDPGLLSDSTPGVCAQVRLQIDQQAV